MAITRDREQLINAVASLDFFDIRSNIQTFLQSQTQFTDYNFEGSDLSVILNILAYYTFYKGIYLNSHISEMFLSTAVQRAAAVARAKQEGYVPSSVRSSSAGLTLNLISTAASPPSAIDVPRGTRFTVQQNGQRYNFSTQQDYSALPLLANPSVFSIPIIITEGQLITQSVDITTDNILESITLTNQNIDTSTISVIVYPTESSLTGSIYNLPQDFVAIDSSSNVFFLEEVENLQYNIYFGDGILGRALASGNVVDISYLVSSGTAANGASTFALSTPIPNASLSNVSGYPGIVVTSVAASGAPIETVESIKINAPLLWQSQQRAVTTIDAEAIVKDNFNYIQAISVWGGQDNVPVALGYLFICILPQGAEPTLLTSEQKTAIETLLNGRYSVLCIQPVVVDPDFVFIDVDTTVIYNSLLTNNPGAVASAVQSTILAYGTTLLNFGDYFKYSPLGTLIDKSDPSITNSLTTISLEKRVTFSTTTMNSYLMNYYNPIKPLTISSTLFTYTTGESISVDAPGSGYSIGDIVTLATGSPGAVFLVASVGGGGSVGSLQLQETGYYSAATPTVPVVISGGATTTTGSGTGLTINYTTYNYPSTFLSDDGAGNLRLLYNSGSNQVPNTPSLGTVNYSAGQISLTNFAVAALSTQPISVYAIPLINDIYSTNNTILIIDNQSITVTTQADITVNA